MWNLMVLKVKLECYLMRLKVGDKGGARDIFPTIPGLHSSLGGQIFSQKCCNWIALFDEPEAEARI